ncbi:MAG: SDR family NAD(P)-dependent oxidoreductase [Betaproteobacteria bacterium]
MSDRALTGRVAIVTGGVRNIGRAIALELAAQGAAIAVCSRKHAPDVASLISELGNRGYYESADISKEEDVARFVSNAAKALGGVDILVNNASIRRLSPIEKMSLAEWREVMAANLDAAFLCARACVPLMQPHRGRIVNIGGLSAHRGAGNRAHVVSSKAALIGFTKALAIELADRGITVNCVVPGAIETVRGADAGAVPPHPQGFDSPLGRKGRPEEVASMVAYLAGDGAAYVTGQTLHVNGGLYLA